MWGPPVLIWFINPINYSYLRFINHSYWSYVHQLSYHLGAPLCRWEVFKTLWHPVLFVLGNGIPWMIIIPWLNQLVNPNDQSTGVCAYVYIYIYWFMFRWFSYSKKGWHSKRWVCVFHNLPQRICIQSQAGKQWQSHPGMLKPPMAVPLTVQNGRVDVSCSNFGGFGVGKDFPTWFSQQEMVSPCGSNWNCVLKIPVSSTP